MTEETETGGVAPTLEDAVLAGPQATKFWVVDVDIYIATNTLPLSGFQIRNLPVSDMQWHQESGALCITWQRHQTYWHPSYCQIGLSATRGFDVEPEATCAMVDTTRGATIPGT